MTLRGCSSNMWSGDGWTKWPITISDYTHLFNSFSQHCLQPNCTYSECTTDLTVVSSTGALGPSILSDDCTSSWQPPDGATGADAQIIIDLGCTMKIRSLEMRNMQQERGTEDFSLYVGQVKVGPWTKMFDGTLQLGTQVSQRYATRQEICDKTI